MVPVNTSSCVFLTPFRSFDSDVIGFFDVVESTAYYIQKEVHLSTLYPKANAATFGVQSI